MSNLEAEKANLNIRLDKNLRDVFVAVCKSRDDTSSRVLREFMRDYIRKYGQGSLHLK